MTARFVFDCWLSYATSPLEDEPGLKWFANSDTSPGSRKDGLPWEDQYFIGIAKGDVSYGSSPRRQSLESRSDLISTPTLTARIFQSQIR